MDEKRENFDVKFDLLLGEENLRIGNGYIIPGRDCYQPVHSRTIVRIL